jgi:hypothetical protein
LIALKVADYRFNPSWGFLQELIWCGSTYLKFCQKQNKFSSWRKNTLCWVLWNGGCYALFSRHAILKEPGGIIVVKPVLPMSQIAQIVESNNGKLLGLFVSEVGGWQCSGNFKITLGAKEWNYSNIQKIQLHYPDRAPRRHINNLKRTLWLFRQIPNIYIKNFTFQKCYTTIP